MIVKGHGLSFPGYNISLMCRCQAWHNSDGKGIDFSCLVASKPCVGDKLSIALVESAAAASELLAWHSQYRHSSKPVRIWDLQRLQVYDKLQQQKQAQASFTTGACVVLIGDID